MIQRGGQLVLHRLANVRQTTIEPIITATVAGGSLIHTDEHGIYAGLQRWGHGHKTVCHGRANTPVTRMVTASARCTSTPSRGCGRCCAPGCARIAAAPQDKLPSYLGFFQFVHNARRRGKALLGALVAALIT